MSFWPIIGASAGSTGGREEPGSGSSLLAAVLASAQQASGYSHAGREHSGNQPARPENASGGDAAGRPGQSTTTSSSDAAGGDASEIRPNSSDAAGSDPDRLPQPAGGPEANPPTAAGSASTALASVLDSIRDSGGGGPGGGGGSGGGPGGGGGGPGGGPGGGGPRGPRVPGGGRPDGGGGARDNSAGGRGGSFAANAGRATVALGAVAASSLAANAAFSGLINRTLRVNAQLSAFSGEIAAAVAEAEAAGIRRSYRQGQVIGPAYRRLSEAQNEYRDMVTDIMAPLQSAGLNIAAAVAEIRNGILGSVAPVLQSIAEGVDALVKLIPGANNNNPQLNAARAFLADIADGKMDGFGTSYGQPGNRPLMNQPTRDAIFGPPPGRKPRRRPAP